MDMELKRAFTEMQVNKVETTKKIRILDTQMDTLNKQKLRYDLTAREVDNLADNAKVYVASGRMFVLSSMPEVKTDLNQKRDKVEKIVDTCAKQKNVILNNLQEQEQALRDMVDAKKSSK